MKSERSQSPWPIKSFYHRERWKPGQSLKQRSDITRLWFQVDPLSGVKILVARLKRQGGLPHLEKQERLEGGAQKK